MLIKYFDKFEFAKNFPSFFNNFHISQSFFFKYFLATAIQKMKKAGLA